MIVLTNPCCCGTPCVDCTFTAAPDYPTDHEAPGYDAAGAVLRADWDAKMALAMASGEEEFMVHIRCAVNWADFGASALACANTATANYTTQLRTLIGASGSGVGRVERLTKIPAMQGIQFGTVHEPISGPIHATLCWSSPDFGPLTITNWYDDGAPHDVTFTDVRFVIANMSDYTAWPTPTFSHTFVGLIGKHTLPSMDEVWDYVGPNMATSFFGSCTDGWHLPHWGMFWQTELGDLPPPLSIWGASNYDEDHAGATPVMSVPLDVYKYCWKISEEEYIGTPSGTKLTLAAAHIPVPNRWNLVPCDERFGGSTTLIKTFDLLMNGDILLTDLGAGEQCYTVTATMETTGGMELPDYEFAAECAATECRRVFELVPCDGEPDETTRYVWTLDPTMADGAILTTIPGQSESKYNATLDLVNSPTDGELPAWSATTCGATEGPACVAVFSTSFGFDATFYCYIASGALPWIGACVDIPDGGYGPFTGTVTGIEPGVDCGSHGSWNNGTSTWTPC